MILLFLLGSLVSCEGAPQKNAPRTITLDRPAAGRYTYITIDSELVTLSQDSTLPASLRYVVLNGRSPVGWVFMMDVFDGAVSLVPRNHWFWRSYLHRQAQWAGSVVTVRSKLVAEQHPDSDAKEQHITKREAFGDGEVDIVAVDFQKRLRSVAWSQPLRPDFAYVPACVSVGVARENHRRLLATEQEAVELRDFFKIKSQDFVVCGMTATEVVSRETLE